MGDTWQYRVRVSGPDRTKWLAKAKSYAWGGGDGDRPMYMWPQDGQFIDRGPSKVYKFDSNWFNVTVTETESYAEFFGNCNGSPGSCFSKKDPWRVGPALFADFLIDVEVVGLSWSCDNGSSGVSSYRDYYTGGECTSSMSAKDESVARLHAPELITEFPDDYTAEERAEMAAEDAADRAEEAERAADSARQQRETWTSLLPGECVEVFRSVTRDPSEEWVAGIAWIVERRVLARGHEVLVLRKHLDSGVFSGRRLEISFGKVGLMRRPTFCQHDRDNRSSVECPDCAAQHANQAVMVMQMIHGLHARPVC